MDVAGRTAKTTAARMVTCYKVYSEAWVCSWQKTNLASTQNSAGQASKEPPPVVDVLKDLGMDATRARLRRLPTQTDRVQKVRRRVFKLGIFERSQRQRLLRTNVFPALVWGHRQMGVAPTTVKRMRALAAKASGSYAGLGHVAMRLNCAVHQDPLNFVTKQQVELWFRLCCSYPSDARGLLSMAWTQTVERLNVTKSRWQVVKGPLGCYGHYLA